MSNKIEHNNLVTKIIKEIPKYFPGIVVWKNETGYARAVDNPERMFAFGFKGSPDIIIVAWHGLFIGFEVKTGNATLQKNQAAFKRRIEKIGGKYFIVRSTDRVIQILKDIKNA